MLQMEQERNEAQLTNARALLHELSALNPTSTCTTVVPGSLVTTTSGTYYLSVGLGGLTVDGATYYAISMASPVGQQLKGKSIGDSYTINGKEATITSVR